MRVPLIGNLEANSSQIGPYPAADAEAGIVYLKPGEDNRIVLRMDKIYCMDLINRRNVLCFDFREPEPNGWEVSFTDERVTFWNPKSTGLFGNKPKIRPGKSTGGQLYYKNIGLLKTGYFEVYRPFLAMTCARYDGIYSSILLFSSSMENMRNAASILHSKITAFMEKSGVPLNNEYKEGWTKFVDTAWSTTNKDIGVTVPNDGILTVSNSKRSTG